MRIPSYKRAHTHTLTRAQPSVHRMVGGQLHATPPVRQPISGRTHACRASVFARVYGFERSSYMRYSAESSIKLKFAVAGAFNSLPERSAVQMFAVTLCWYALTKSWISNSILCCNKINMLMLILKKNKPTCLMNNYRIPKCQNH